MQRWCLLNKLVMPSPKGARCPSAADPFIWLHCSPLPPLPPFFSFIVIIVFRRRARIIGGNRNVILLGWGSFITNILYLTFGVFYFIIIFTYPFYGAFIVGCTVLLDEYNAQIRVHAEKKANFKQLIFFSV